MYTAINEKDFSGQKWCSLILDAIVGMWPMKYCKVYYQHAMYATNMQWVCWFRLSLSPVWLKHGLNELCILTNRLLLSDIRTAVHVSAEGPGFLYCVPSSANRPHGIHRSCQKHCVVCQDDRYLHDFYIKTFSFFFVFFCTYETVWYQWGSLRA